MHASRSDRTPTLSGTVAGEARVGLRRGISRLNFAWRYQNRAALGKPKATLADIAAENKVSSKYLATIWSTLA